MSAVKLSGDVDCPVVPHLNSGCGFPAPNAEIFFLEPYATLNVAGMDFVIGKTSIIAALVSIDRCGVLFSRSSPAQNGARQIAIYW